MLPFVLALMLGWIQAAGGQVAGAPSSNKLVSAKLVYVEPMPFDLDKWIIDDLRAWNRFRQTANSEGVDILIRAKAPERDTRFKLSRQGVPQPKRERNELPVESIVVLDWVTGARLFQADLVNQKPKDDSGPPASEHIFLNVRGMKPDQIAQKFVTQFRLYVEHLQSAR